MTISAWKGSFSIKHLKVVEFKAVSYNKGNIHFISDEVSTFYAFFRVKKINLTFFTQSCD